VTSIFAAVAFPARMSAATEWIALIAKAVATYGRLDILVNNAGISGGT
jgi:NAD(P)-dependent dehydrogenase (short-subunit alcohol dehydrogenase family)